MGIKRFKPITPTLRHTVLINRSGLYKGRPIRRLTAKLESSVGRNNTGKITTRHKQKGAKRVYRLVDLKRDNHGIKGEVVRIEYDPNRTCFIALVKYVNGDRRYILAPDGLKSGDVVESGENAPIALGNAVPLSKIPSGTSVFAVSLRPNEEAKIALSAGSSAQVMGSRGDYVQLRMPSGEIRLFKNTCYATIGIASNLDNFNEKLGKAGRSRNRGIRPTVRGVAMSYKHPHGGGQGKGGRHGTGGPKKDIYGNLVGKRTRKPKKTSNKFIVSRRQEKNKFKSFKTII
ncbi:50S ribosomal protein L2 [Candidatus Dojkabacteria bacterium]|uniref:50S ribosomal protein L2 n=1 Tax=Candidatus Dojkabacteria bacterium TaxID=2099670 RepID=A0A3M0Z4F4_9BACT|nr:MAG: 50S ribosomal protein L2 [Candidatus Dojkabacteria bacterium]